MVSGARWILAIALLVLCLLFAGTGAEAATIMRQDVDDGNYLEGHLSWNGGRGGVAWSRADSQDPGGPGTDVAADVYESEPTPRKLYINASRNFELDLYLAGQPGSTSSACLNNPTIGAELRTSDLQLVGGATPGATMFASTTPMFAPDPEGFGVCRIRFASEVGVLQAGTVLRLIVTHKASDTKYPLYGMGDGHQSILRIPYFADDEMPYRYPSYPHGAPAPGMSPSELTQWLKQLGGAGLAASLPGAGALARRRSVLAVALIGLFLTAGLAGCASSGGPRDAVEDPDSVAASSVVPVYQEDPGRAQGRGSLTGQVIASDIGEPVQGARAILLGTPDFTFTDPYGRFTFRNLEARTHHLRVERSGYEAFEAFVAVREGLTARIDVPLVPLDAGNPMKRPHNHDYWGDKTQRTLVENMDLGLAPCNPTSPCPPALAFRVPPPQGESEYASILPGTYEVNVSLDWDPQAMGYETVGLTVQANNDPSPANFTAFLPRRPGEMFNIATTWEMDDPGHQRFSTWTFVIYPGTPTPPLDPIAAQQRNLANTLSPPTYSATVAIRKGVVPFEPAHPDPWRGAEALDAIRDEVRTKGSFGPNLQDPSKPYKVLWWRGNWLPARPVPPETTWVDIWLNISRDPEFDVEFRYKTAASGAPTALCWSGYLYGCDDPEPGFKVLGVATGTETHWVLPVAANEPDPFYAVRSFWVFGVQPKQDPVNGALFHADGKGPGAAANVLRFSLTVVSHRGPVPE